MTTPSLTNPNPKREGANQARHLTVNEPTEHANDAIYVHDEDDNDIATFFHSDHATVGQSYETALRLATLLVEANNASLASARPSPGDPVRAAAGEGALNISPEMEGAALDAFYGSQDWRVPKRTKQYEKTARRDMRRALLAALSDAARAALSVSTPTGEGERVRHVKRGSEYEVLGEAEAQVSEGMQIYGRPGAVRFISDGAFLTVYRCLHTGKLWCRFTDEFRDGRFETVAPASVSVTAEAKREGWKLVPVDPTEEMLNAPLPPKSSITTARYESRRDLRPLIYRAMIAAAPTSASKSSGEEA